ncbi:adipocyte plasma membrane-associated protein isoform X1 [Anarhichas minor]|uniref:adipocyte plasma membrane-associated protein isoform X1 n=1 Tax=Anarhichas minor TaxID=65739 RepID=UPI003F73C690
MNETEGLRFRRVHRPVITDELPEHRNKGSGTYSGKVFQVTLLSLGGFLLLPLLVIILILESPIHPEVFSLKEPPLMKGCWEPNLKLREAQRLFEDQITGPESIASIGDVLYAGTADGKIVKLIGRRIHTLTRLGKLPCGSREEESSCGRPLGIRVGPNGTLFVADAYLGLFQVNPTTGERVLLDILLLLLLPLLLLLLLLLLHLLLPLLRLLLPSSSPSSPSPSFSIFFFSFSSFSFILHLLLLLHSPSSSSSSPSPSFFFFSIFFFYFFSFILLLLLLLIFLHSSPSFFFFSSFILHLLLLLLLLLLHSSTSPSSSPSFSFFFFSFILLLHSSPSPSPSPSPSFSIFLFFYFSLYFSFFSFSLYLSLYFSFSFFFSFILLLLLLLLSASFRLSHVHSLSWSIPVLLIKTSTFRKYELYNELKTKTR